MDIASATRSRTREPVPRTGCVYPFDESHSGSNLNKHISGMPNDAWHVRGRVLQNTAETSLRHQPSLISLTRGDRFCSLKGSVRERLMLIPQSSVELYRQGHLQALIIADLP